MIDISIGDHGELYKVYATGQAEPVALQLATAICVVYADLKRNLPPEEAEAFKGVIRRCTADGAPLWNDPEMQNHVGDGSFIAFLPKGKYAEPEDAG